MYICAIIVSLAGVIKHDFPGRAAEAEENPMSFQTYISIFQVVLILLIALATAFMAYQLYRTNRVKRKSELYKKRLRIYREIVRLLSVITRDGDISRDELLTFRSKTHESGFLFGNDIIKYVEEVYSRSLKLRSSNELLKGSELRIGEERDNVTVENSKQLIWLADQLPLVKQKFEKYLNLNDMKG